MLAATQSLLLAVFKLLFYLILERLLRFLVHPTERFFGLLADILLLERVAEKGFIPGKVDPHPHADNKQYHHQIDQFFHPVHPMTGQPLSYE